MDSLFCGKATLTPVLPIESPAKRVSIGEEKSICKGAFHFQWNAEFAKRTSTKWWAKMDSKGGSWQQSGGLLQPPWLFRRKASPFEGFSSNVINRRLTEVSIKIEASLSLLKKKLTMYLENWTLWLWCNYEKATVKEIFSQFQFQNWEGKNTIFAKRNFQNMSLHNSTNREPIGLSIGWLVLIVSEANTLFA